MVAKLWKARVLLKKGDKSAATATAQDGVKAATCHTKNMLTKFNVKNTAALIKIAVSNQLI
jgi:hypothetical protein